MIKSQIITIIKKYLTQPNFSQQLNMLEKFWETYKMAEYLVLPDLFKHLNVLDYDESIYFIIHKMFIYFSDLFKNRNFKQYSDINTTFEIIRFGIEFLEVVKGL